MWRTIGMSWGFTLREDNSTCVYRNSIHALSALRPSRKGETASARRPRDERIGRRGAPTGNIIPLNPSKPRLLPIEKFDFTGRDFPRPYPLNSPFSFPPGRLLSVRFAEGEFIIVRSATVFRDSERHPPLRDVSSPAYHLSDLELRRRSTLKNRVARFAKFSRKVRDRRDIPRF